MPLPQQEEEWRRLLRQHALGDTAPQEEPAPPEEPEEDLRAEHERLLRLQMGRKLLEAAGQPLKPKHHELGPQRDPLADVFEVGAAPAEAAAAPPGAVPPPTASPAPAPPLVPPQQQPWHPPMALPTSQAQAMPTMPVQPGPPPQVDPGPMPGIMPPQIPRLDITDPARRDWMNLPPLPGTPPPQQAAMTPALLKQAYGQLGTTIGGTRAMIGNKLRRALTEERPVQVGEQTVMSPGWIPNISPAMMEALEQVPGLRELFIEGEQEIAPTATAARLKAEAAAALPQGPLEERFVRAPLATLYQSVGTVAGSFIPTIAAGIAAGPAGAMMGAFSMESGNKFQEDLDRGADRKDAADAAFVQGLVGGSLEAVPVAYALRSLKLAKQSKNVRQAAADIVVLMLAEGTTESLQEVSGELATYLTWGKEQGMTIDELASPENRRRYLEAFALGTLGGGMLAIPSAARRLTGRDVSKEAQAKVDAELADAAARADKPPERDVTPVVARVVEEEVEEEVEKYVAQPEEVRVEKPKKPYARPEITDKARVVQPAGPFQPPRLERRKPYVRPGFEEVGRPRGPAELDEMVRAGTITAGERDVAIREAERRKPYERPGFREEPSPEVPRAARERGVYAPVVRGERGRWKPVRVAVAPTGPQEKVLRQALGELDQVEPTEISRTKAGAKLEIPGDPETVQDLLERLDAWEGTAPERRAAANLAAKIRRAPKPIPERLVPPEAEGRVTEPPTITTGGGPVPTRTEQAEFWEAPPSVEEAPAPTEPVPPTVPPVPEPEPEPTAAAPAAVPPAVPAVPSEPIPALEREAEKRQPEVYEVGDTVRSDVSGGQERQDYKVVEVLPSGALKLQAASGEGRVFTRRPQDVWPVTDMSVASGRGWVIPPGITLEVGARMHSEDFGEVELLKRDNGAWMVRDSTGRRRLVQSEELTPLTEAPVTPVTPVTTPPPVEEPAAAARSIDDLFKAGVQAPEAFDELAATAEPAELEDRLRAAARSMKGSKQTVDRKRRWLRHLYLQAQEAGKAPAPEAPAAPDRSQVESAAKGTETTAMDGQSVRHEMRWVVMELGDLIPSNKPQPGYPEDPRYPKELQKRARTRKASEQQIDEIADDLNPEALENSVDIQHGSPIVEMEGFVSSGNGRTLALNKAYDEGNAEEYRAHLVSNAGRWGLRGRDVDALDRPVLVRVRKPSDITAAEFARRANKPTVATMSEPEQGQADAAVLTPDDLDLVRPASVRDASNRPFVQKFMEKAVPSATERGTLMTTSGELSSAGERRIQNALLAAAYRDPGILARLRETTDEPLQRLSRGLIEAAPWMAKDQAGYRKGELHNELDPTDDIVEAVDKLLDLREAPRKKGKGDKRGIDQRVDDYLSQPPVGEDELTPTGKIWLRFFHENRANARTIRDGLRRYSQLVVEAGSPQQEGLFGKVEPPARDSLANRAVNDYESVDEEQYEENHPDDPNLRPPSPYDPEDLTPTPDAEGGYIGARQKGRPIAAAALTPSGRAGRLRSSDLGYHATRNLFWWGTSHARGVDKKTSMAIARARERALQKGLARTREMETAKQRFSRIFYDVRAELDRPALDMMEDLLNAMEGKIPWTNIPDNLREAALGLRDHMDELTGEILTRDMLSKELRLTLMDNVGEYIRRTYQLHRAPKEWRKFLAKDPKGIKIWNVTEAWLKTQPGFQQMSETELVGHMWSLVGFDDTAWKHHGFNPNNQKMDLTEFMRRKDLSPQMRMFLGEDSDVGTRYLEGAKRVIHDITMYDLNQEIAEILLGAGLASTTKQGERTESGTGLYLKVEELRPRERARMGRLGQLYTTPAIKEMLEQIDNYDGWNGIMDALLATTYLTKVGKTVGSPMTQARNKIAWTLGVHMRNGHLFGHGPTQLLRRTRGLPFKEDVKAWRGRLGPATRPTVNMKKGVDYEVLSGLGKMHDRQGRPIADYLHYTENEIVALTELGIWGESVTGGELARIGTAAQKMRLNRELSSWEKRRLREAAAIAGKAGRTLADAYAASDDIGHWISFLNHAADLLFAEQIPLPPEGYTTPWFLENHRELAYDAAERTRANTQTYSRLPRGVKAIRAFPLVGSLPSFLAAEMQAAKNQGYYIAKDTAKAKDNWRYGVLAANRLAGNVLYYGYWPAALAGMITMVSFIRHGWDDDDETKELYKKANAAVPRLAAPWETASQVVITDARKVKGMAKVEPWDDVEITFIDLSTLLTSSYVNDVPRAYIRGMYKGVDGMDKHVDGALAGAKELLAPMADPDIAARGLFEALAGYDIETGDPYVESEASRGRQATKRAEKFGKAVLPGAVLQGWRLGRSFFAPEGSYGHVYKPLDEAMAIAGVRQRTSRPMRNLSGRSRDFHEAWYRETPRAIWQTEDPIEKTLQEWGFQKGEEDEMHHQRERWWNKLRDEISSARDQMRFGGYSNAATNLNIEKVLKKRRIAKKYIPALIADSKYSRNR